MEPFHANVGAAKGHCHQVITLVIGVTGSNSDYNESLKVENGRKLLYVITYYAHLWQNVVNIDSDTAQGIHYIFRVGTSFV